METTTKCALCCYTISAGNGKLIRLTLKGVNGVLSASRSRGIHSLKIEVGDNVHADCRLVFTNKNSINTLKRHSGGFCEDDERKFGKRRCDKPQVECFYCSNEVEDSRTSLVKTAAFVESITKICDERADAWSTEVRGRLEFYAFDLHAADVMYHHDCDIHFRTGRSLPLSRERVHSDRKAHAGRHTDAEQLAAFEQVSQFLVERRQATIPELTRKMDECLRQMHSTHLPYSKLWMKKRLEQKYGDSIHISRQNGSEDVVTCAENMDYILRDFYRSCQTTTSDHEKARLLIKASAEILKKDMREIHGELETETYPTAEEMSLDSIMASQPPLLKMLLEILLSDKEHNLKTAFLCQAIVQNARPRSLISPLNFGLGVSLYHVFRSRYLIDVLNSCGVSCSYNEVLRFVRNAAAVASDDPIGNITDGMAILFAADNVDHNAVTLDGRGTFHGLGIMAAVTPGNFARHVIPRKTCTETANTLREGQIEIREYYRADRIRSSVILENLPDIQPVTRDPIDIMWELSTKFASPMPSWNGMMCHANSDEVHAGKSSYYFLPLIDLHSTDYTCLYSALSYISGLATKHQIHPIVTLDQPLYWKSASIIDQLGMGDPVKDTVLLLGSFHTLMNYLGAIGYLMSGSGLEELLTEVYADNVIPHILSGKAVSRALRGHILLGQAVANESVAPLMEDPRFAAHMEDLETLYLSMSDDEFHIDTIKSSSVLSYIHQAVCEREESLRGRSRTNRLWINYIHMVQTARNLVRAERSGNWDLHLSTTRQCLEVLAAAGHYNYTKSVYLYLQNMNHLGETHPEVFAMFCRGLFVSRRTDKYWSGLGSDLAIEQILMRGLKSKGGLTRGSGLTLRQSLLWTSAAPIMTEIHNAMDTITNKSTSRSEQHKELGTGRIKRDKDDLQLLKTAVSTSGIFRDDENSDDHLSNVVTGAQAPSTVNVDHYDRIGKAIVSKMAGQSAFEIKFKRKEMAVNMSTTESVRLADGRTIDSALLFQRMIIAAQVGDISLKDCLEYELAPYPPALFQTPTMPLKADKPVLAQAIVKHLDLDGMNNKPDTDHCVIDGGSLLHRVPWQSKSTYLDIARSYATFIKCTYFRPTVCFDGYNFGPTIKDQTHVRRCSQPAPSIVSMENAIFKGKRETVLSNATNKDTLIKMIIQELSAEHCMHVSQSQSDADVLLAQASVSNAHTKSTTLIGEDTDLLMLLLHYYDSQVSEPLYFKSDKKNIRQVYNIGDISKRLGRELCLVLLFVHAFTGCDTTSRVAGITKNGAFKKFIQCPQLQSIANVFCSSGKHQEEIIEHGVRAMKLFFNQSVSEDMATIRHRILSRKIANANVFVKPERLPPTFASIKYHSLRVYYQIMTWTDQINDLRPTDWGWKIEGSIYVPIPMDIDAAPVELLHLVHCNCKTGCETNRCPCRRYNLPCHSGCGPCQVEHCSNVVQPDVQDIDQHPENETAQPQT